MLLHGCGLQYSSFVYHKYRVFLGLYALIAVPMSSSVCLTDSDKNYITCLCNQQLKGMLKRVHESLQGGGIGDVGLARPHLWQLLHLPCDLSRDLQHRTASSRML